MLRIQHIALAAIAAASVAAYGQDVPQAPAPSSGGGFLQNLFKGAAESALKQQLEKSGLAVPQQAGAANALVQAQQQAQVQPVVQQVMYDPGCKRGQLINPYYVMLQANVLQDASLADMPCVSATQIQTLHTKYSKMLVK